TKPPRMAGITVIIKSKDPGSKVSSKIAITTSVIAAAVPNIYGGRFTEAGDIRIFVPTYEDAKKLCSIKEIDDLPVEANIAGHDASLYGRLEGVDRCTSEEDLLLALKPQGVVHVRELQS